MSKFLLPVALVLGTPAIAAEPSPKPPACADSPAYHAQDFIAGTWAVHAGDILIAHVTITPELDHCALSEVWTPVNGMPDKGLGLFVFSRPEGKWRYLWAADTATSSFFEGTAVKPGEMLYTTTRLLDDGRSRLRHWQLIALPDGRIRELATGSDDDGRTWTTEYDLTWSRSET